MKIWAKASRPTAFALSTGKSFHDAFDATKLAVYKRVPISRCSTHQQMQMQMRMRPFHQGHVATSSRGGDVLKAAATVSHRWSPSGSPKTIHAYTMRQ